MKPVISIGNQDFRSIRENHNFYVDKSDFIREWWENQDTVTLITRPRRFGKTLNMSMLENFFSIQNEKREDLFEGLAIWEDQKYRALQGSYPVIFLSFASVKGETYPEAREGIIQIILDLYTKYDYLRLSDKLSEKEKAYFDFIKSDMSNTIAAMSLHRLALCMNRYYGKKVLILLDEYDTPLLEAYTDGYWEEMIGTCRQLFHAAFKENAYYSRAIITGVTRVTKNSLFSDLNNIEVDTVTCDAYSDCFGFTEEEVIDALQCQNVQEFSKVKAMYDGFIFGSQKDIYNPWSICNYLRQGELICYWTNTSSNKLIGEIIRKHPVRSKHEIEQLMAGETVHKKINENVTFQYLDGDENSLWSLFLAIGYIKADYVVKHGEITECDVSVTNQEVMEMFRYEVLAMFDNGNAIYNDFVQALLQHNVCDMNDILLDIAYTSMSYFDVGKRPSERAPENFYHGLVLGLIVSLRYRYRIVSNRESGRGRYDIAMYPLQDNMDAFLMEFKVHDEKTETNLETTADNALRQIEEKGYEKDLHAAGIKSEHIYKLGFAFSGKDVLVKEDL